MQQSLSRVNLHIVFSTKKRCNSIPDVISEKLYAYISGICHNLGCDAIQVGGMPDHIHILANLGRSITISKLVSKLKANSSRWLNQNGCNGFSWQSGYGVFSIGNSGTEKCRNYILNQKIHHKKITFVDEYRSFLDKYMVRYDEKYLWD